MKITRPVALFASLISFFAIVPVFAGGWTSGGGNVLKDSNNPWFLKNTEHVTYCIWSDPATFGDLPTPLPVLAEKALAYWKGELSDPQANQVKYQFGSDLANPQWEGIAVGTQTFIFNPTCSGSEDLVLQFGVLTAEQRAYLQDPNSLIGIAVRTSYDEVRLRGKGFIYISPDAGALRYRGDHLRDRAWHEGKSGFLYRALAHEIGHVFGLPHGGGGLMSEAYSESLVLKHNPYLQTGSDLDLPHFFHYEAFPKSDVRGFSFSLSASEGVALFGQEFNFPVSPRIEGDGAGGYKIILSSIPTPNGSPMTEEKLVGTIQGKIVSSPMTTGYGIKIFMTQNQRVFPEQFSSWSYLVGPTSRTNRLSGKFTPALPGGREFSAILTLHPDFTVFDAIVDGEFKSNLMSWSYSVESPF